MRIIFALLLFQSLDSPWPDFPTAHWVGLFPQSFLEEVVANKSDESKDFYSWEIDLYAQSNRTSNRVGTITVEFSRLQDEGFGAVFKDSKYSDSTFEIAAHLFDPDWGYGPYFHLTALDWSDGLTKVQFSDDVGAVGGDFEGAFGEDKVEYFYIERGSILSFGDTSIYVEHLNLDSLVVRKLQPVDFNCTGEKLQYAPYETYLIKKIDWIGSNGKSRFNVPNTRGC